MEMGENKSRVSFKAQMDKALRERGRKSVAKVMADEHRRRTSERSGKLRDESARWNRYLADWRGTSFRDASREAEDQADPGQKSWMMCNAVAKESRYVVRLMDRAANRPDRQDFDDLAQRHLHDLLATVAANPDCRLDRRAWRSLEMVDIYGGVTDYFGVSPGEVAESYGDGGVHPSDVLDNEAPWHSDKSVSKIARAAAARPKDVVDGFPVYTADVDALQRDKGKGSSIGEWVVYPMTPSARALGLPSAELELPRDSIRNKLAHRVAPPYLGDPHYEDLDMNMKKNRSFMGVITGSDERELRRSKEASVDAAIGENRASWDAYVGDWSRDDFPLAMAEVDRAASEAERTTVMREAIDTHAHWIILSDHEARQTGQEFDMKAESQRLLEAVARRRDISLSVGSLKSLEMLDRDGAVRDYLGVSPMTARSYHDWLRDGDFMMDDYMSRSQGDWVREAPDLAIRSPRSDAPVIEPIKPETGSLSNNSMLGKVVSNDPRAARSRWVESTARQVEADQGYDY